MDKELPLCKCGCGQEVKPGNRFIHGHNQRGTKASDETKLKISNPIKNRIDMEGITQDIVRELFDYIDSDLYWKMSKSQCIKMGDLAGNVESGGYRVIGINGKIYKSHRLIFLYHHGYIPEFLDHIDGNKLNNDISNLRAATLIQNGMNQKKHKSMNGKATSSDYKGVTWDKQREKWRARISIEGKLKHLGRFTNEIEAAKAYNTAAIKHFGDYACLNTIDEGV